VPKLLGVEKTPGNFFEQLWGVIKHLPDTNLLDLLVGLLSLILVLALKRWLPLVPGTLVVVILSILSSGMVVNGSLSKTAVNGGAGAKSQVSGLVVAVLVIITLLFLTGLFESLPEATLAAVVIAAVIELVDIGSLRRLYNVWTARLAQIYGHAARADFAAAIAAMLGCVDLRHTARSSDRYRRFNAVVDLSLLASHVATLAKQGEVWLDTDRHPDLHTRPDAVVVRVESGLMFANADNVKSEIESLCTDQTKIVVLDAETSPFVDVSAASTLVS
jgi:MFS superfamily sulfate permease-like transporter